MNNVFKSNIPLFSVQIISFLESIAMCIHHINTYNNYYESKIYKIITANFVPHLQIKILCNANQLSVKKLRK